MEKFVFMRAFVFIALAATLACGDVGDPYTPPPTAGFAQGPITQFGSVFVNGTKFSTDDAEIVGGVIDESNRPLGQMVRVEGSFDSNGTTGTATRVVFRNELKGFIESVDPISATEIELTVLGMKVLVEDGYTAFAAPYEFAAVAPNDIVEVSGLADEAGSLRATRIEKEGIFDGVSPLDVEFRGQSTGFQGSENFSSGVLTMGPLAVAFDETTQFEEGFDNRRFSDTIALEVKGTVDDPSFPVNIFATEIKEDDGFGEDVGELDIEGFISGYVDDSEFMVAGQRVDATEAVRIPSGLVLTDGLLVEVEGRVKDGILEADEIKFEGEESKVSAVLEEGALGEDSLTLLGGLVVVRFDGGARWEDKVSGSDRNSQFSFADLVVGDYLEIRGVAEGDEPGQLLATRIERDDLDDTEIEAGVDAFCADPTARVSIPDPNADPEVEPVPTIDIPVAPCIEEDVEAWVEVLGVRVEIRMTTELRVEDGDNETVFQGTLTQFIEQIGGRELELEIEPPAQAPFVAAQAEVEVPEAPAP